MNIPETFLDYEGYPTQEYLEWLKAYPFTTASDWIEFVKVIMDNWQFEGCKLRRPYKGKRTFVLHTWGWSGNEEIIAALQENTFFFLFHTEWHAGGHFYFEIPIK
jgi:hypothetical protein